MRDVPRPRKMEPRAKTVVGSACVWGPGLRIWACKGGGGVEETPPSTVDAREFACGVEGGGEGGEGGGRELAFAVWG